MRAARPGLLLALPSLLLLTLVLSPAASARTIDVKPRNDRALQRAIDRAHSGDRLRVHEGTYSGPILVDKRLKIFGARRDRRPVIDGECETLRTIDVASRRVTLRSG